MDISNSKDDQQFTSPEKLHEDRKSELSLRPNDFKQFIGQHEVIENLKIYIKAVKKRKESLDHVLLFGPQD